jgi:hypothetical protein
MLLAADLDLSAALMLSIKDLQPRHALTAAFRIS